MTNTKISRVVTDVECQALSELLKRKAKRTNSNVSTLKCAIYARKSQEDETDTSLPTQIDYCKELIDSCSLLELAKVYSEDNVSGM